jgi:hypothetical protein
VEAHLHYTDQTLEKAFADCTLDPAVLTHEGHLRLAWVHIRKYGVDKAVENLCAQIRYFDETISDGTKYHETVTVAAVRAIWHFMQKSQAQTFTGFIAEFPRLNTHFRELLAQHYSFDIFQDQMAANTYKEPDIEPFT